MTIQTPVTLLSLREATFHVAGGDGGRDFTSTVSHVLFAPNPVVLRERSLGGDVQNALVDVEWTLALEYPQDWSEASSLSLFLALHGGEQRDVTFTPKTGSRAISANVTLVPGPIGGQADAVLTGIVVMGINGAPVIEDL